MSKWANSREQANHGEAKCDPLQSLIDLLQFCFLDDSKNPHMKSHSSSFTAKPYPNGFYSCKQYLVSFVKCKALLHQLGRCFTQLLSADAVGLQSLEKERKQQLPKSEVLWSLSFM